MNHFDALAEFLLSNGRSSSRYLSPVRSFSRYSRNYTPTAFREGELLSAFRPESRWNTSRSTALGFHRLLTGICYSTRPSRPRWLKRFSRFYLVPRFGTLTAPSPVPSSPWHPRSDFQGPRPSPNRLAPSPINHKTSIFLFSASARPQYCSPWLSVSVATSIYMSPRLGVIICRTVYNFPLSPATLNRAVSLQSKRHALAGFQTPGFRPSGRQAFSSSN